jgi:AcrR family transcriptional regulator
VGVSSRPDDILTQILMVTANLAIDEGIDAVKVSDVADACGVSEATVYYHFVDRAHLISAAVITEYQQHATWVYDSCAHNAEVATDLADFQRLNVEFLLAEDTARRIRSRWNFTQVASRAHADLVISMMVNRCVDAIWTSMEGVFNRTGRRGWNRPELDTDALIPYLMAEVICTALDSVKFGSADDAVADFSPIDELPKLRRALARSVAIEQHGVWDSFEEMKASTATNHAAGKPRPAVASPRAAATRRRILDAARAEIIKVGTLQFHLRAVAERADVSVSTIYKHFSSREALLYSAGDAQVVDIFNTILDTIRNRNGDGVDGVDGGDGARADAIDARRLLEDLMRHDGVRELRWQMIEAMTIGRRTISPELAPLLADPRFRDLWSVNLLAMAIMDLDLRPAPLIEVQEATFLHVYDWMMRDHSV